jgi:hypothetical protein
MIMKTTNYFSKIKNTLAMLVVLGSTVFFSQEAKAQNTYYTPFCATCSYAINGFYDINASQDLHYRDGWARSSTNVAYNSSGPNMGKNLLVAMTNVSVTEYIRTGYLYFTGATQDTILVTLRQRNNSSGGSTITVKLLDSAIMADNVANNTNNNPQIGIDRVFNISAANTNDVDIKLTLTDFQASLGIYVMEFNFQVAGSPNNNFGVYFTDFSAPAYLLPVDLMSFEANQTGKHVNLKWITASEKNNSHFEVQRSKDGEAWLTLGTVEGSGSSDEMNVYQFMDMNPMSGINYYRLKQVDFNGDENYSDLREVFIGGTLPDKVSIYPNPAGNFVNVDIPADVETVKTEIRTVDGRVLMNNTYNNTTQAAVSIEHLTPGMYYIHIQMGDQTIVRPFVKQ